MRTAFRILPAFFLIANLLLSVGNLGAQSMPAPVKPMTQASPSASPTPLPLVQAPPTLSELQSAIRSRRNSPELRRGQVGIKIVSLKTGKSVFEENGEKYFMPASNMKNFTVAAALEKLTPDFRFITSVYAAAMPDQSGTIAGNLRIYGRGDVSYSKGFSAENTFKGLDDLVAKILESGVKKIEGNVVADDSYFIGDSIPAGWEWDDLQWYYGAEISALPFNDNVVELSVKPGPVGYQCSVTLKPVSPIYRVSNRCVTSSVGSLRSLKIQKALSDNQLVISGNLPADNAGFSGTVSVSRPSQLFAALLKQRLEAAGVTVGGRQSLAVNTSPAIENVELAKIESPPLSLIAAKTMKPSQNMYTEVLLWTLGEEARRKNSEPATGGPIRSSSELGIAEVTSFLTSIGVATDEIVQYDGSGLSRHNLITPTAVVKLYEYMANRSKFDQAWRDSLTIGGVDGTLQRRFIGTRAAGNMRGKTGTIDQVSALSGYVTTAGGEQLILSIVVNGVPETRLRTRMIDDIVVELANYTGRID